MAKKAAKASKPAGEAKPKFGTPEWQAKYGKGKTKASAAKKTGK